MIEGTGLTWKVWKGNFLRTDTFLKLLKNISQKLIPVTASLGPGNVTATGTLPEEGGANFTSSTLLLFLLAQLRAAAWERPGWSGTGKAGPHTHD